MWQAWNSNKFLISISTTVVIFLALSQLASTIFCILILDIRKKGLIYFHYLINLTALYAFRLKQRPLCENASEGWDIKNVMQYCRAPLHLSFLSHLQTAALLTESKSESNFPSWKWYSIDPRPKLIRFLSCLGRNQIMAQNMCVCVSVCVSLYCISICLKGVHMCLYTWRHLYVCLAFQCRNHWAMRWPQICNMVFLPPLIKVKRWNAWY